jgi:hypothetical protein
VLGSDQSKELWFHALMTERVPLSRYRLGVYMQNPSGYPTLADHKSKRDQNPGEANAD